MNILILYYRLHKKLHNSFDIVSVIANQMSEYTGNSLRPSDTCLRQ